MCQVNPIWKESSCYGSQTNLRISCYLEFAKQCLIEMESDKRSVYVLVKDVKNVKDGW